VDEQNKIIALRSSKVWIRTVTCKFASLSVQFGQGRVVFFLVQMLMLRHDQLLVVWYVSGRDICLDDLVVELGWVVWQLRGRLVLLDDLFVDLVKFANQSRRGSRDQTGLLDRIGLLGRSGCFEWKLFGLLVDNVGLGSLWLGTSDHDGG
jgi:hypothetical protein